MLLLTFFGFSSTSLYLLRLLVRIQSTKYIPSFFLASASPSKYLASSFSLPLPSLLAPTPAVPRATATAPAAHPERPTSELVGIVAAPRRRESTQHGQPGVRSGPRRRSHRTTLPCPASTKPYLPVLHGSGCACHLRRRRPRWRLSSESGSGGSLVSSSIYGTQGTQLTPPHFCWQVHRSIKSRFGRR